MSGPGGSGLGIGIGVGVGVGVEFGSTTGIVTVESHGPPVAPGHGSGASSDIGEVSAAVPLTELFVATSPLGTPAHQWAWTACAAHPLGFKGMLVAAKVLGASMVDLVSDPATVAAAKAEFTKATKGKPYASPFPPDAKPAVF